jgi:hypothetical protein
VVGYGIGWVCVFLGAPVSVKLTRKFCAAEEIAVEEPHQIQIVCSDGQ